MAFRVGVVDIANKTWFVVLVGRVKRFEAYRRQFFTDFYWFVVLTTYSDVMLILVLKDRQTDNRQTDKTDHFTLCACAWGNNGSAWGKEREEEHEWNILRSHTSGYAIFSTTTKANTELWRSLYALSAQPGASCWDSDIECRAAYQEEYCRLSWQACSTRTPFARFMALWLCW